MKNFPVPGSERPASPPETIRRLWLQRRAAISSAAVDLLLERALGELPPDAVEWPTPAWAGPVLEPVHA